MVISTAKIGKKEKEKKEAGCCSWFSVNYCGSKVQEKWKGKQKWIKYAMAVNRVEI